MTFLGALGTSIGHSLSAFSSGIFWFGHIQVALLLCFGILYYCFRNRLWQNGLLLLLGFYGAYHVSRLFFALALASSVVEWWIARRIQATADPRRRSILVWSSVAMNASLLLAFVLPFDRLVQSRLSGLAGAVGGGSALGWLTASYAANAFFLFSRMTLTLDVYNRRLKIPPTLIDSLAFSFLLTRSWGTPMDRARDTLPQLQAPRSWKWSNLEAAAGLVLLGAAKYALSLQFGDSPFRLLEVATMSKLGFLLGAWGCSLRFWLVFSGIIDISRGLGALLGIAVPVNFDAPLYSTNVSDFWRRWNITFGNWLYEEVFARINFLARKLGNVGLGFACLGTFLLSGIAHGFDASVAVWIGLQGGGVYVYFIFRSSLRKWAKRKGNPRWFGWVGWFATAHLFVIPMASVNYPTFGEMGDAVVAFFRSPVWHAVAGVDAGVVFSLCGATMFLHYLPHLPSYESLTGRWPRLLRIAALLTCLVCVLSVAGA